MRPIARKICYRHVHISSRVQWSIQISQPLALYVLAINWTGLIATLTYRRQSVESIKDISIG